MPIFLILYGLLWYEFYRSCSYNGMFLLTLVGLYVFFYRRNKRRRRTRLGYGSYNGPDYSSVDSYDSGVSWFGFGDSGSGDCGSDGGGDCGGGDGGGGCD